MVIMNCRVFRKAITWIKSGDWVNYMTERVNLALGYLFFHYLDMQLCGWEDGAEQLLESFCVSVRYGSWWVMKPRQTCCGCKSFTVPYIKRSKSGCYFQSLALCFPFFSSCLPNVPSCHSFGLGASGTWKCWVSDGGGGDLRNVSIETAVTKALRK